MKVERAQYWFKKRLNCWFGTIQKSHMEPFQSSYRYQDELFYTIIDTKCLAQLCVYHDHGENISCC